VRIINTMTRFLTLLSVTCFALVAWGQQPALVGLPEYGVTLTGTVQNPVIVNNSGRTIIGHVLCLGYASGGAQCRRDLNTRGLRLNRKNVSAGIPPGGTESPMSPLPNSPAHKSPTTPIITNSPNLTPPTFTRVVLDSVVFADGQFVGPDSDHGFEAMSSWLIDEQELAALVSAARKDPAKRSAAWAEVNRIIPNRAHLGNSDIMKLELAGDLLNTQKLEGEAAAYDVADREMAIPKLWRAQQ
jgi:hypothetical protein